MIHPSEADVRKRCEAVFRDATGHPSFLGRDGVDLRDVFAGMIRDAHDDGLEASERELQAIRDTEFALRQQVARLRGSVATIQDQFNSAELKMLENGSGLTEQQRTGAAIALEFASRTLEQALRETGA